MIRAEYQRFMQTLQGQNATESLRKVANIISAHFGELLPLTTYQGQRIRKMVELCQANWDRTPTNIPPFLDPEVAPEVPLYRLKTMTVPMRQRSCHPNGLRGDQRALPRRT